MCFFDEFEKFGGQKVAVEDSGNIITYKSLKYYSNRIRDVIKDRSLVFLLCRNDIGTLAGYISFLSNRIVPLLLDANIDNDLLSNLINIYHPSYIYLPKEYEKKKIFSDYENIFEDYCYSLLKTNDSIVYPLNAELGLLLTTSGSTGSPKLVRQSYKNIQENAKSIAQYLKLSHSERPITTLPMNYTYGLSIVNSHILVGATILLTEKSVLSKEFWSCLKEQKATSIAGVPYTYEMLKKIRFLNMKLPDLRYMTQAGGKLSAELHKEFAEYALNNNKEFIVMYGQTEATARMAYLPAERSIEKYGSMGIAIPGGELILIDSDDNEIKEPNIVGELVYKGPNVTLGYAESGEDLNKGDERQGVLKTGDMAKMDEEGFFYIVGRKKRFIKLYGNRINLDEIDNMIRKEFPDIDCASTGTDEKMVVYITQTNRMTEVQEMISRKTHVNRNGILVKFIDLIPRNDAGKIMYKDLE